MTCNSYVKEAYEAKKWAFVSDYARLKVIYENGGIYLDTDVELLKPLDELLTQKCFFGSQTDGWVNTGLGFGPEKGSPIILSLMEVYRNRYFLKGKGVYDLTPCPVLNSEPLAKAGYVFSETAIWSNKDFTVFPPEYFFFLFNDTGVDTVTEKTFSIHLFSALWVSEQDREVGRFLEELKKKYSGLRYMIEKQKGLYKIAKKYDKSTNLMTFFYDKIRKKLIMIIHH